MPALIHDEVASHAGYVWPSGAIQIGYWIGVREVRPRSPARLYSSAAATFNAPVTSIKNMAAGRPLFSRALFPSFDVLSAVAGCRKKSITAATSHFDICGDCWVGPP